MQKIEINKYLDIFQGKKVKIMNDLKTLKNNPKTFTKFDLKVDDICWCSCHKANTTQLDMIYCCPLQGKTYLDEDGKLVLDKYFYLMERLTK